MPATSARQPQGVCRYSGRSTLDYIDIPPSTGRTMPVMYPTSRDAIDEVPKTSTGKFDRKRLRERLHDGNLLRQTGMASSPTA